MTMMKGDTGPLRDMAEGYGPQGKTLPVPTTSEGLEDLRFEGEVDSFRYVDRVKVKKGAHSLVYTATDTITGRTVGLKRHLHAIPLSTEADAKEIRSAEHRFRSEAAVLGKMRHPSMMEAYGIFFEKEGEEKIPYLVMEYISEESLGDKLERGEPFSEAEAREVILSVGTGIDYMHRFTGNGHPVLYRDLKPDNVKDMGKDASWPHKIVDFSESKVGNATINSGSVVGTPGFNAPEIYGAGQADERTDRYSLARMAIAMVLPDREKFNETWFGTLSLEGLKNTGDLRVSDDLLRVFERATARDPSDRYSTFLEMVNDMGYNIERVPQTRQELERILESNSLPVQVQSQGSDLEKKLDQNYHKEDIVATVAGVVGAGLAGGGILSGAGLLETVLGISGGVALSGIIAGVAGIESPEGLVYHIKRGLLWGAAGAAANAAVFFSPLPPEQKMYLGMGIQSAATLIQPARIAVENYLSRRREKRKRLEKEKEKNLEESQVHKRHKAGAWTLLSPFTNHEKPPFKKFNYKKSIWESKYKDDLYKFLKEK